MTGPRNNTDLTPEEVDEILGRDMIEHEDLFIKSDEELEEILLGLAKEEAKRNGKNHHD